jgi:hypothetical protein
VVAGIVTLQSGISSVGDAFRSLGNAAVQVLQQVISKLASAAALAAVLGPILGVSSAGFGSIFKASLGGQAIPLASGGIVTGPTLAMVGEGGESEAVMPLSKLESMMAPTAAASGGVQQTGAARLSTAKQVLEIPIGVVNDAAKQGATQHSTSGFSGMME